MVSSAPPSVEDGDGEQGFAPDDRRPDRGGAGVRNAPISHRIALAVGVFSLYGVGAAPFFAEHQGSVLALAVMPVSLAGWLLGMWGGLLAGLALIPLRAIVVGPAPDPTGVVADGIAPWIGVLVLVGIGVGGVRELADRWERELRARGDAEAALRSVGAQLEERVRQRTTELERANEALAEEVAERRRASAALQESEHRFRQLAENTSEVFWLVDVPTSEVLYVGPAFERVWGRPSNLLYDRSERFAETIHPEDREHVSLGIVGDFSGVEEQQYRIVRPSGDVRWVRTRTFPVRDEAGRIVRLVGISEDDTERKEAEQRLQEVALRDPLTGLANRISFMNRLGRAFTRLPYRPDMLFAVLFMDMDDFKEVNDRLGHLAGDELLRGIARRLEACIRPEDLVARMGGDEFTILLHEITGPADAARVASRVLESIAEPLRVGRHHVPLTASVGIALSSEESDPEAILRDADAAMYRAKSQGDGYVIFDAEMHAAAMKRLQLETDLTAALEKRQFFVDYQPIVSLADGMITGVEALVRWRHPIRGIIGPDEFVPVAEATGQMLELGRWVLDEACREFRHWRTRLPDRPLTLSLNLSGRQLVHPELLEDLGRLVDSRLVDPTSIRFEITEGALIEHPEKAETFLRALKALGLQIQIDDFGTGYASINQLERFPIDTVKIDGSLVARIGGGTQDRKIIAAMIDLAHSLGLDAVAEAVETAGQLEFLRNARCEFAQGYHFSAPLPANDLFALLEENRIW